MERGGGERWRGGREREGEMERGGEERERERTHYFQRWSAPPPEVMKTSLF